MKNTYRKIPFSDVVVKTNKNAYLGRKWNLRDIIYFVVVLSLHVMCLLAPSTFNRNAFWVAAILYVITGMFGLLLSYHRHLSHSSFKLPKLLEYFFAYCGVHALQGHPIDWVSRHRFHHKYTDTERDPHTPVDGFWFGHISWIFNSEYVFEKVGKRKNVGDLRKQFYYRFLQRTYLLHPLALAILLYKFGGWPFVVWGMILEINHIIEQSKFAGQIGRILPLSFTDLAGDSSIWNSCNKKTKKSGEKEYGYNKKMIQVHA
ncbi:hypothetical protein Scep_019735 [Stephania cephalantha]|uniref:Fatty acid desaturase domain-containing protein n=1 Tax=Stephania cephalantha TaxID=152367 RepID=A0AAP0ICA4_9MAGN